MSESPLPWPTMEISREELEKLYPVATPRSQKIIEFTDESLVAFVARKLAAKDAEIERLKEIVRAICEEFGVAISAALAGGGEK